MAQVDPEWQVYEFRLSGPGHEPLVFAASLASDDDAADHARRLLDRHRAMTRAEVLLGQKLIRQV